MSETQTLGPCTECGTPRDACTAPDYCCEECLHFPPDWDGYEQPEPARPVGGDTREALREVTVPLAALQDLVYAAWSDRWQVIGEFCVGQDESDREVERLRQIIRALGVPELGDDGEA